MAKIKFDDHPRIPASSVRPLLILIATAIAVTFKRPQECERISTGCEQEVKNAALKREKEELSRGGWRDKWARLRLKQDRKHLRKLRDGIQVHVQQETALGRSMILFTRIIDFVVAELDAAYAKAIPLDDEAGSVVEDVEIPDAPEEPVTDAPSLAKDYCDILT